MSTVDSTSDARTINNAVRNTYRVLSDDEKAQMQAVKDQGQEFLDLIDSLRSPMVDAIPSCDDVNEPMPIGTFDRELNIAAERVEEAVMWAVKHITA